MASTGAAAAAATATAIADASPTYASRGGPKVTPCLHLRPANLFFVVALLELELFGRERLCLRRSFLGALNAHICLAFHGRELHCEFALTLLELFHYFLQPCNLLLSTPPSSIRLELRYSGMAPVGTLLLLRAPPFGRRSNRRIAR